MTDFNYKKYLTENKLTQTTKLRAGILAEGQFSWMTQDTGQQISSQDENTIPDDMMEGLNEAKMYYHVLEDGGYGRIGHQGYYNTPEEAKKRADTLSDMFPKSEFYVEAYPSKKEPVTVTMEGKKEYYKDAEADDAEHIKALEKDMKDDKKSSKMKMSELKAKIKEMALAEMNLSIDNMEDAPESEVDFLAEVDAILAEADEDEIDDTEVSVDGEENIDVDTTVDVNPNVKAVQDALTQAQAAAQKLGDSKLTDQIGNTITFFTRSHVVDQGAVAEELNESMFPLLKRILK